MANPKKRLTSTRSGNRRSHLALKMAGVIPCPKCSTPILPHIVCPKCGYYKHNQIIKP